MANTISVKFKISEERFFNNGKIILNSIPEVKEKITRALSMKESLSTTLRKKRNRSPYVGIEANSLNKALRRCLSFVHIKGETHVENGVFFHNGKEGFDFSIYDEKFNMARLYNYYQGSFGLLDGDKKIINIHEKMGYTETDWKGKIGEIRSTVDYNTDYIVDKEVLTVVGELQFGNWALIYRNLFRLLEADSDPGIDFYIYVAADEELSGQLSANTVSYKSAGGIISESLSVIKTPIWLIGLGIDRL